MSIFRAVVDQAALGTRHRGTAIAFVLAAAVATAMLAPDPAHAQDRQVTFMAGGAKGSWFRFLTGMSECLRTHSNINATVVPTSGGMEAFGKLSSHQADIGFTYQSVLHPAWHGADEFKGKKYQSLRVIGVAEELAAAHFVVSEKITSVADLAGKSFAPGPVGTVTYVVISNFLRSAGVYDKVKVSNVSHGEMITYLKDGKIDGWALLGGLPNPATTESAVSGNVRLLSLQEELESTDFLKKNAFFKKATIPAGLYPGIDYDVVTFAQNGILVVNQNVPEDLVYDITKVLWSDACVKYLSENHRALEAMKESPVQNVVIPLHAGAERFWKERGIDTAQVPTAETM